MPMEKSDFNLRSSVEDGEGIAIEGQTGRFLFFKVRRFGRLHFKKQISEEYLYDLLTKEALHKEFEIGYGFDHPGIVRYLAFEEDALYEEYIDGQTLRRMLDNRDERLNKRGFLNEMCRQLMETLVYIHSAGVVHLDIKPENVMITNVGNNVKLIDFSCARNDVFDTTEGYTEGYKAPEQNNGRTNTYTDIYLLGKLMEELSAYTGREHEWRRFIKRATASDPTKRFGNDAEVIASIPSYHSKKVNNWQIVVVGAAFVALIGWGINVYTDNLNLRESVRTLSERTVSVNDSLLMMKKSMEDSLRNMRSAQEKLRVASESAAPVVASGNVAARPVSMNDKLKEDIINYVSKRYKTYVLPLVNDWDRTTGELAPGYTKKSGDAMTQSIEACVAYGRGLAQRYPQYADYIERTMVEQINIHQSMYGSRREEAYKRWSKTHGYDD